MPLELIGEPAFFFPQKHIMIIVHIHLMHKCIMILICIHDTQKNGETCLQ